MSGRLAILRLAAAAPMLAASTACERAPNGPPPGPIPTAYSMDAPGCAVPMPHRAPKEKCYAIARAQATDGGAKGPGTARHNRQTDAWLFVPTGTCLRFGGSLTAKADPRP